MVKQFTDEDDALLTELGVEVEAKPDAARTPEEERVNAGYEEIQRFVEEHGHPPCHGEDHDIFERLYAVRLDRIRDQTALAELVRPMDSHGLLSDACAQASGPAADELDDDALLAELGIDAETPPITELRHVRSTAEKRAAEEVALRERCEDFETFRPLFDQVQSELDSGLRETRPFEMKAEIEQGR